MNKLLFIIVLICFSAQLDALNRLCIILDYGHSEAQEVSSFDPMSPEDDQAGTCTIGAMTSTLLPALYQQASVLLVSTSLLKKIGEHKKLFNECLTLDVAALNSIYGKKKITCAPSLGAFKKHCQYAHRMYRGINNELEQLLTQGSDSNDILAQCSSKKTYQQDAAPRTLQYSCDTQRSLQEALHHELQVYSQCAFAPLTPATFIIKKVSAQLTLLIPCSLVNDPAACKHIPGLTACTPLEKKLGIQVNHLPDVIDTSEFLRPIPVDYSSALPENLHKVFVKTHQGSTSRWTLYMTGHGLPPYREHTKHAQLTTLKKLYEKLLAQENAPHKKSMLTQRLTRIRQARDLTAKTLTQLPTTHERVLCSLPLEEFQKTLQFFSTDIRTSLLYYTSCFGGGNYLVTPFQRNNEPLTFSYDIIAGSATDSVLFQKVPSLQLPPYRSSVHNNTLVVEGITLNAIDMTKKCLTPCTSLQFEHFFTEAQKVPYSAHSIAGSVHPYLFPDGSLRHSRLENYAHYRKAGTTTFTPVENKRALSLIPKKAVTIPERCDLVFLNHTHYGSITIQQTMPPFISLVPGTAAHRVKQLTALKTSLSSLADSLMAVPTLNSSKLFWITTLECKKETRSPLFFPLELMSALAGDTTVLLHDVVVIRNVITSETLTHNVSSGLYFSDGKNKTWFCPLTEKVGNAIRVSHDCAYAELRALFPD